MIAVIGCVLTASTWGCSHEQESKPRADLRKVTVQGAAATATSGGDAKVFGTLPGSLEMIPASQFEINPQIARMPNVRETPGLSGVVCHIWVQDTLPFQEDRRQVAMAEFSSSAWLDENGNRCFVRDLGSVYFGLGHVFGKRPRYFRVTQHDGGGLIIELPPNGADENLGRSRGRHFGDIELMFQDHTRPGPGFLPMLSVWINARDQTSRYLVKYVESSGSRRFETYDLLRANGDSAGCFVSRTDAATIDVTIDKVAQTPLALTAFPTLKKGHGLYRSHLVLRDGAGRDVADCKNGIVSLRKEVPFLAIEIEGKVWSMREESPAFDSESGAPTRLTGLGGKRLEVSVGEKLIAVSYRSISHVEGKMDLTKYPRSSE